jgi:hypothetical protein
MTKSLFGLELLLASITVADYNAIGWYSPWLTHMSGTPGTVEMVDRAQQPTQLSMLSAGLQLSSAKKALVHRSQACLASSASKHLGMSLLL